MHQANIMGRLTIGNMCDVTFPLERMLLTRHQSPITARY